MLESMSSSEILEWTAYYNIEPFGYHIENHRWGLWCSTYANANRDPKKNKTYKPTDFFRIDYGAKPQAPQQQKEQEGDLTEEQVAEKVRIQIAKAKAFLGRS